MKKLTLIFLIVSSSMIVNAQQIINYDGFGNNTSKSRSEVCTITFDKNQGVSASASPITGIISPVIGLAVDLINAKIAKNKAKYSATYSAQVRFPVEFATYNGLQTNGYTMHFRRFVLDKLDEALDTSKQSKNMVCDYGFKIDHFGADYIELQLVSVNMVRSKAKIKNTKDNLTVSLSFKSSTPASAKSSQDKKDTAKQTAATSGDAIIKIPIIRPGVNLSNIDYPSINHGFLPGLPEPDDKNGSMTLSVTVTEANIDHLDPTVVEGILKNNSSDISAIFKALFPGTSSAKTGK